MTKGIITLAIVSLSLFGIGCNEKSSPVSSVSTEKVEATKELGYQLKFKGQGNEPGWQVIVTTNEIVYTNMNLEGKLVFKNVKINPIMDIAGVGYSATSADGAVIHVQAIKQKCDDTMADATWPFKVSVTLTSSEGEKGLSGCGEYLEDERLLGIWYLNTLNGNKVKATNSEKKPKMEFYIKKNSVSANMGCNGMGGTYELMDNTIYFGKDFMSTQMYCGDVMALENEFTQTLVDKSLKYTFENHQLILSNLSGKVVMIFAQD